MGVPLLLATGWLWLQTRSVISCCGMTDTAFLEQSQRLDIADLVAFLVISVALLVVCGGGLIFGLVSLTMNLRQNS